MTWIVGKTSLRREFNRAEPDTAWNIDIISDRWWPRLARRIFLKASPMEQRQGSQIMLAWAHPTNNAGDIDWPQTHVCVFRSPEFKQEKTKSSEALSIGSGSGIQEYEDAVQEACDSDAFYKIMQGANPQEPHLQAGFLASSVESIIKDNPQAGVSPFIQIGVVTRGQCYVYSHEYDLIRKDGSRSPFRLPVLWRNYSAFLKSCQKCGYSAEGATCIGKSNPPAHEVRD